MRHSASQTPSPPQVFRQGPTVGCFPGMRPLTRFARGREPRELLCGWAHSLSQVPRGPQFPKSQTSRPKRLPRPKFFDKRRPPGVSRGCAQEKRRYVTRNLENFCVEAPLSLLESEDPSYTYSGTPTAGEVPRVAAVLAPRATWRLFSWAHPRRTSGGRHLSKNFGRGRRLGRGVLRSSRERALVTREGFSCGNR